MNSHAELLTQARQLHQGGQPAEALPLYRQVVAAEPGNADAWFLIGMASHALGQTDEALAGFAAAGRLRPNFAEAHHCLGSLLAEQGRLDEAIECFQRVLQIQPTAALTAANLQRALAARDSERGKAHLDAGEWNEAIECHRRVVTATPADPQAHFDLAVAWLRQDKLDEAVAGYRQALELDPNFLVALGSLANVLRFQWKLDEAIACYERALALRPNYAETHYNYAVALEAKNDVEAAIFHYRRAIELQPEYVDAHCGLSHSLLVSSDFENGWREYEWRLRLEGAIDEQPGTLWDGSPLAGRSIFLHCEQGIGDNLQFIRYAALLKEQGARVIVGCRPMLAKLLATCPSVDQVVIIGELLPEFDVCVPLLSLPYFLRTRADNIPAQVPYLFPDPALIAAWRNELAPKQGFRVGIAWQGNPRQVSDKSRSLPLSQFAGIAAIEGVHLVSLQFGAGKEQLDAFRDVWPITDLGDRLGDFHNTAAVVRNLDLVITCDSSPAHLAGAIGAPVWTLLMNAPDWRWLLSGETSAWYPTMRLFRQRQHDDWPGVMSQVEEALKLEVARKRGGAP